MTGSRTRGVVRLAVAGAAAVVAAAAAGCGGGETQHAARRLTAAEPARARTAARPAAVVVPAGYRVHRSTEGGVALALPLGWQALAGPDARYPGVIQTLARVHRAFLPYLVALASPESSLKLFAFDAASDRRHPSIASIQVVSSAPPGSFARWSAKALRSLGRLRSLRGPLNSRRVDLPAGTALRVEFARSDGDRVVLYVVARRTGLWAVTFAAPPHAAGRAAFDRAAATLVLAEPRGGPQIAGGTHLSN